MPRKARHAPSMAPVAAPSSEYAEDIAKALATEGGHLLIGQGGATLWHANGWLSGCSVEQIRAEAIAAGLPVIDGRELPFESVRALAVHGPLVAVGVSPSPPPYHALSYAPLAFVAVAYRAAGAAVFNMPSPGVAPRKE